MDKIGRIHKNFDSLCDNYRELPGTKAAYNKLDAYLENPENL